MKTRAELIQDHLENQLTAEEKSQFDRLYAQDVSFKEEVYLQEHIYHTLQNRLNSNEQELRSTLGSMTESMRSKPTKVFQLKKWIVPVLAAACLLIIGRIAFFSNTYYDLPVMQSEIVRGQEDPQLLTYEDAVKAFNNKDYIESASILAKLIEQNPNIIQYQYYYALSVLGSKEYAQASQSLLPIAEGETVFRDEANYYLAIAYIELGKVDQAKKRIDLIPSDSNMNSKAQKLLEKLK